MSFRMRKFLTIDGVPPGIESGYGGVSDQEIGM